jgi:hypothetical protein
VNTIEGKWYKVTGVAGNTVTFTPGLREAITTTGLGYRLAYGTADGLTQRFVIPTGYAKVIDKNKGNQNPTLSGSGPSFGTKCVDSPACADGTTYLTYLPP